MKRHDTHLLSDESEKEKKEEDAHSYNSKNSSNYSEEKLISKESEHDTPLKIDFNENIQNNDIDNYKDKNVSIISTKELEDIFYNEDNNIKNINLKKKRPKKNKYYIKLRKIKLNNENNDEIIDNCLTYNLTLRNDLIDKKINKDIANNKHRNCISLNNLDKKVNNHIFDRSKLKKSRDKQKEKEILYFFYNDDTQGSKKLQNVINIINRQKLQLLQISNNNFSIKTKKKRKKINKLPIIDINKKNKNIIDFEHLDMEVRKRKINYSRKVYRLNSSKYKKGNQLILNNNKKLILKSSQNKDNSANTSLKNKIGNTQSQSTILKPKKSNEKIDLLYNLYCSNANANKEKKKLQRVKSTESLMSLKQKESTWVKMNNNRDNNNNNKYLKIHNNEKYNRSLITKLYKIQTGKNSTNNYNIHFGNNENCPFCQAIELKNEENIKKMGIFPMFPNFGNNENSQNSWRNRRVYSALSRILSKTHKMNINEYEGFYDSKNKSRSISKNRSISKDNKSKISSSLNKNIINDKMNKNESHYRQLNIKRSNYLQNTFSTSNKFLSTKSQSIKFN